DTPAEAARHAAIPSPAVPACAEIVQTAMISSLSVTLRLRQVYPLGDATNRYLRITARVTTSLACAGPKVGGVGIGSAVPRRTTTVFVRGSTWTTWLPRPSAQYMSSGAPGPSRPALACCACCRLVAVSTSEMTPSWLSHQR